MTTAAHFPGMPLVSVFARIVVRVRTVEAETMVQTPGASQGMGPGVVDVTVSHAFVDRTRFAATTSGMTFVQPSVRKIAGDAEPLAMRAKRKKQATDAHQPIPRAVTDVNARTVFAHLTHTAARPHGMKRVSRSAQKIAMAAGEQQEIAETTQMDALPPTPPDVEAVNANSVSALSMTIAAPTPGTTSA